VISPLCVLRGLAEGLRDRCTLSAVRRAPRLIAVAAAGTLVSSGPRLGPYDIMLFSTAAAPTAEGRARLVFAESPFGISVTSDGHARYDVQITASKLPAPATLGAYTTYVAWSTTPDLKQWVRLGPVSNGTTTVGSVDFNKFILVIAAARDSASTSHDGPTVLHGTSPSGWLQQMMTAPVFHGVN
jgi:hypothetical protein